MTENSQGKARQLEQKVGKQMCECADYPVCQVGLINHKSLLNVEEAEEEEFRMMQ